MSCTCWPLCTPDRRSLTFLQHSSALVDSLRSLNQCRSSSPALEDNLKRQHRSWKAELCGSIKSILLCLLIANLPADDGYLLLLSELVNAVDVIDKLLIADIRGRVFVDALRRFSVQSSVVLVRADDPVLFGHGSNQLGDGLVGRV